MKPIQVLENFIVLEGLDGAGTTTQLELLEERLTRIRVPHFCTYEPTRGDVGKLIHETLRGQVALQPKTIALLFAADRLEHLCKPHVGIVHRLERGELVVSDRYLFSSLAYQSIHCGFDFVLSLNQEYPLPKYLFFIDTPVSLCQTRLAGRPRLDLFDPIEMQEKVDSSYRRTIEYFQGSGMIVKFLDGRQPPDRIFNSLWENIRDMPIMNL
ncbi:MAG TPA: dTMP kinase [Spirochaetia bacterium]|nr:dTMP kinase [Spirochaetia bacterium]